jgi:hypothetical protein
VNGTKAPAKHIINFLDREYGIKIVNNLGTEVIKE